jgi:hypothetical protein
LKHVYRAYPASTKSVQAIASLVVGGALAARGLSHHVHVNGALLGIGALAIAVQGIRFIPGRVIIGEDGVLVRSFWSTTFVRRSDIASIDQQNKTRLRIQRTDGSLFELELMTAKSATLVRAEVARLGERAAAESGQPRHSAAFAALAARVAAWAASRGDAPPADASPASVAYRSGDTPEQLWEIAEDVDAPALARVGAVHALGPLDDGAKARVRELARSSADPLTSAAFEAAAAGDVARLRAVCTGRTRGVVDALSAATASGGPTPRRGVEHALLHPNRPILALAWLSRLWFLAPLLALASSSPSLTTVTVIVCAVGALPWAAAREGDPLLHIVPGAVSVEDGFVVQNGERLLDVSTVTAAYLHFRVGFPPVVRLEGRFGWPLLDVRLDSVEEARAFLRRLPLREAQRDARFGTMYPGPARLVAFAIAAIAVATVFAFMQTKHPQLLAAALGLAISTARLRRLITVKREGLHVRSVWTTRFIPFSEVAEVERRKDSGVVVLTTGERFALRTVSGALTDVADDDLTETVIARLEEHRATQAVRTRVAADALAGEPLIDDAALELRDEDVALEAKRSALPPRDRGEPP